MTVPRTMRPMPTAFETVSDSPSSQTERSSTATKLRLVKG